MKKDKGNDNKNIIKNPNKINEEQKNEEEEEDPNLNTIVTGSMKDYKKMESKNLSTFPALISLKDKPQNEKIEEEKKALDKKLWVPDEHVQNCYNCGEKFFSLLNRKHHCRVCGNIFCKSCLESFWEITIYEEKKELKVCSYCQEKKGELNDILKKNLVEYRNDKGNKIFETKTWDYVKNKKYEQNNIDEFCGFNNLENTLTKEFHDNLNKTYETLLEKMIYKVLNEKADSKFSYFAKSWGNILYKLTKTVIDNVCPSFQDLNDSININEFVKIKLIKYHDQSLCQVIDGYALQKNVSSKKMRRDIQKPKILLLKGSLEGLRINRGNKGANSLVIKSSAVEDYIEIIRKKIEAIAPQIIIVEGNASQKYQDFFSADKMNISLITKCSIKQLNRIARCVNSFVVPSPDLIGKQVILGSCAQFKVQTIKIKSEKNKNDLFMRAEEYNLMRFEGCGKVLFNTIILSGPDLDELKELKKLMKIIVKTARFLYCQKFILKYFNMYYDPSIFGNPWEESESISNKNKISKKKNC